MHILFLTHYFPPEVNAPATRTYEHCRRWVEQGHRVTVITCAPNCPDGIVFDGYRNAWKTEATVDGMRVIRVWTYLAANAGMFHRIVNYVSFMLTGALAAARVPGVDVVVATSPQFFCGWTGVLCRWVRRWPFVLEIRDIWPEAIVTVGAMRRSPLIRLLERLERWMYRSADHIVTVGDGYREKLLDRGVPPERISVVPNGVDLTQFEPRPVSARSRPSGNGRNPFVCGYIGTIGMAHGLDVVLDAAERLQKRGRRDVRFSIVGAGADCRRLQAETVRRGLDSVEFKGLVAKHEIPEVIAACDACLVHLRATELFGTVIPSKIFETMAMNVPIIMGVRGQAQQIVLDAGAGVAMTPDDADSLIACIENLGDNGHSYSGGRCYVEEHYNRDHLAMNMLDVLTLLAAGTPEDADIVPVGGKAAPASAANKKAA